MEKEFDLNIDKILDHWAPKHAIREIISNALDEKQLSKSKDIEIVKIDDGYYVRDYGRGIEYKHFVQNESDEKLNNHETIGKFGIGLKDALATFNKHGIDIKIISKHNNITIKRLHKHNFDDTITLHAIISPPEDKNFIGTQVELKNISDNDMDGAKSLFLQYKNPIILDSNKFGQIIKRSDPEKSHIYFNGIKVSEENNFLFDYNITLMNKKIRDSLNRERNGLNREAYSSRIVDIILHAVSDEVKSIIGNDFKNKQSGTHHDELNYKDIQIHAINILSAENNTVFLTKDEILNNNSTIDDIKSNSEIVMIPNNIDKKKLNTSAVTFEKYVEISSNSFEFEYVDISDLTLEEKQIYDKTDEILKLINIFNNKIKILISEKMRKESSTQLEAVGLWDGNKVTIKRDQLQDIGKYAGTLIHEFTHAYTNTHDVTREFESELTRNIGKIIKNIKI